jgi:hypothetical protein
MHQCKTMFTIFIISRIQTSVQELDTPFLRNSLEYSVVSCANEVRKTKRNWILKLSLKNNFYIFSINIESWDLSRLNNACVFSLSPLYLSYYSVNHISGRDIHSLERHVTCETGHLRRYHQYNN